MDKKLKIVKKYKDEKLDAEFVSERIESRFHFSQHDKISYNYFLLSDNKIISYIDFMDEHHLYSLGFLEYWVHREVKQDLVNNFPVLTEKTLYLSYIFTDEKYRSKQLTSNFLKYVCSDLSNEFSYIWLRKETHSSIFQQCGFIYLRQAIEKLVGKDEFLKVYDKNKNYSQYNPTCLSEHDFERMVVVL